MKFKTTKSALLSSVVILAICFSMFVGSTYAWFTDSVSSAGNVIQSGTLDVKFWMYNATEGDYSEINNESKPIFGADSLLSDWEPSVSQIWEPGKTQIVYLGVENDGTLALKYNILIDVLDLGLVGALEYAIIDGAEAGALTLNDWDDVVAACNGQTADIAAGRVIAAENGAIVNKDSIDYFALAIHMKEDAGNEYQNKSIVVDINVIATQLASESDSFGSDYDADPYFNFGSGTATISDGASAVDVEVRDEAGYKVASALVPAGAMLDGANEIKVNVKEDAPYAGVVVAAGQESKGFDVSVVGLDPENEELITVELRLPTGLNPATVQLYHYGNPIDSSYNPADGYVTFRTATFSPFTVVYDAESEYVAPEVDASKLPEADVTKIPVPEKITWGSYGQWSPTAGLEANLETTYVFKCTETAAEAALNPYANWYCDFYVSLDKDLGENQLFLGGNYGSFGWIGFHNGDITPTANTEIGLLEGVTTNPWTYLDVATYVGEFTCGVGDVNDALVDATFTVKLRLTNPENSAEYFDVETITYTFAKTVNSAQDLQDAIDNGVENVVLGGDMDLNDLGNLFN